MGTRQAATLGFRAKTGRAIAVALAGSREEPRFLLRREVALIDESYPYDEGPYHPFIELPWEQAMIAVQDVLASIERQARKVVAQLAKEIQRSGFALAAIGVVGSPDRNLEKIGSPHIRAHAAEGVAFRKVLEAAAAHHAYPVRTFSDRTIGESANAAILKSLGKAAGAPWRADERAAATAAWIVLPTS